MLAHSQEKLLANPNVFDKKSVLGMLNFILYTEEFDISKMDIVSSFLNLLNSFFAVCEVLIYDIIYVKQLHFPSVISDRWVLMSVNPLYNTITSFDSSCSLSQRILLGRMNNLVLFTFLFFLFSDVYYVAS